MHKTLVLLVEDDISLTAAFGAVLGQLGYEFLTASNGQIALNILKEKRPDIILLDLLMPVMDGKEFLKKFKNVLNIPIIVFSNLDSRQDVTDILELGASKYMLKSWATPKTLSRLISTTLNEKTNQD